MGIKEPNEANKGLGKIFQVEETVRKSKEACMARRQSKHEGKG